jgi:hypothetical protein
LLLDTCPVAEHRKEEFAQTHLATVTLSDSSASLVALATTYADKSVFEEE